MAKTLPIEKFLPLTDTLPLVDVRSPAEFTQGHIPGAVNIPLFNNDERAIVGIGYKQGGKEHAVQLGLEIVGPKLAGFVKQAKRLAPKKEILVHCWRGGMRSSSMAWLFETAGLKASILEGGYKAYRRYIRQQFSRPVNLLVLGGYTGSGKTDILKILQKNGEQFLDIEHLAHHKGSVFGPLGQPPQPTNEQFENNLADAWRKFDFSRRIWTEDESRQLGKCVLPDPLFFQLREAPLIKIIVPKSEREKRLVHEYGEFKKEELKEQLVKIRERLGGQYLKEALEALDNNALQTVASIALRYYDKAYDHGISRRPEENVFELKVEKDHPEENARLLLNFINHNLKNNHGSHLS
ncbi:tRNA 2-selenouridine(34) synthase MnmH [Candidatus Sulfidibacterium hydrothermale]|uniref:tRNA 2-selenouridine(34) synthase MnmH n=1 Tax=Candidatus Sulfidibacterium hydrothermale TaxID=2875962 RepID=UPI001F0A0A6F|nr:tRNA 2-selenouridine(34) synthase MnmH [Candidatus Sulfidibacterium hydrothermale]UBM62003.1 tRNA 2-selenouridine(34) synthase MnmH [Candidatus Sulfidibacterium hydrothermale]